MPYTKDQLETHEYYQNIARQDEFVYNQMIEEKTRSGDISDGILRDRTTRNILLFDSIISGQGSDGTVYPYYHTLEYEDGYFDYEEGEEINSILDREFKEL
jgi:hypothetical protein|tara:strand:+ start:498 stop:800 length:303 start_codon:yes stop_codon:yes gene_type:complete